MGVVIHDDMYEAMTALPKSQQSQFLRALVDYGFTGQLPKGNPPWKPTFIAFRDRVALSAKRSKTGKSGGLVSKQKKRKQSFASEANDGFACNANDKFAYEADSDLLSRVEDEDEDEYEEGVSKGSEAKSFPIQCLKALNEELGRDYTSLPPSCVVDRFEGKYTVDEVRQMIRLKKDQWIGTRFAKALNPNTLFGLEHFEQYMQETRSSAEESREYEAYDL